MNAFHSALVTVAAVFAALTTPLAFAGDKNIKLNGFVRDVFDQPLVDLKVNVSAGGESDRSVRTADDGSFSVKVPKDTGPWLLEPDQRELLERGYFCLPGSVWNPGELVVIPLLEAVPLTPELSIERDENGITCVRLDFDWMSGVQPTTLRQWRIEHSTDLNTWKEVITVGLACPPMEIFDETTVDKKNGFYRAVSVAPVFIFELDPEDFGNIADPSILPDDLALDWPVTPVLIFDPADLPDTVVVAPEIRIRDAGEL